MTERSGAATALAEAMAAQAERDSAEDMGEQLQLLPGLPAANGAPLARQGPGRPPGSKNKSTEQWRQWLLGKFGSPLEALLSIAAADTGQLAKVKGLKPGEAFKEQVRALEASLPYMHQKQPQAVEVMGVDATLILTVNQNIYEAAINARDAGRVDLEGEIVSEQEVSEAEPAQSDGAKSDDGS